MVRRRATSSLSKAMVNVDSETSGLEEDVGRVGDEEDGAVLTGVSADLVHGLTGKI